MSNDFVIWGSSGHGRVLAALIVGRGDRLVALVDNNPSARPIADGVPLLLGPSSFADWMAASDGAPLAGAVAIGGGRGEDRLQIIRLFEEAGLICPALIHAKAHVCTTASVGAGSHVLANATVAADVTLGRGCIVNHGAVIDHESILHDGVHVAPGATLCGVVEAERDVFVGAGATILPRLKLGRGCVIGAGAVVTRDVPPGALVVGVPAAVRNRGAN